jgi:hypothetical protein
LVFPIPPGAHWNDPMPRILPSEQNAKLDARNSKQIHHPKFKMQNKPAVTTLGRLCFHSSVQGHSAKPKRQSKPRVKNDPRHVAAARDLRDRFLEQLNRELLLPPTHGKYDVRRALSASVPPTESPPALPAPVAARSYCSRTGSGAKTVAIDPFSEYIRQRC